MANYTVLDAGQTALLVIDVQRSLFTRPHPVYRDADFLQVINELVDRAHLYGLPIAYIQHSNESFLKEDSDGWKLHPALKPESGDYAVRKSTGNAFQAPALMSLLEARDIKNVIITGLVTQGCIRSTALGGLKEGYRIFLIKGGHSNYNPSPVEIIEKYEGELEQAGVHLVKPGELAFQ